MKTLLVLALLISTPALAGTLGKHDFSDRGWTTGGRCSICHTPHGAQDLGMAPLWNHATTVQQFAPYASYTRVSKAADPGPTSKMCLSCHDGTIALDTFSDHGTMRAGSVFVVENRKIGANGRLTSDHPIAMAYDATLATTKRHMAAPVSDAAVDASGLVPLYGGRLECSSCHDVHDDGFGYFLRVDNSKSQLCTTCHLR